MERVTRLVYILPQGKIKVSLRQAVAIHPPPADGIFLSSLSYCESKKKKSDAFASDFYGAGDEARTRYLHLGKVALYRMSYTRNGHDALYQLISKCQYLFKDF